MSEPKHPTKCCENCKGTGRVELTGIYYETWLILCKCKRPVNSADMSALGGCSFTAMNNRLSALERMGLATSERYGSQRLFTAVIPHEQQVATEPPDASANANRT